MMNEFSLHLANYFFYGFHCLVILFNLFGWFFRKTRKLHLICILTTFASWGILGYWKGWGYCFLTDWHYQVLRKLGETDLPSSYIAFLVQKISGWLPAAGLVNSLTLILALLALVLSLWVNLKAAKKT